jgi:hypothetical protein
MFGWFRRRQDIDLWAAHVATLFKSMRSDCPAAAYLFAATLYNGRNALEAAGYGEQRKKVLNDICGEIAESVPLFSSPDGGMCLLGLRFIKTLILIRNRDGADFKEMFASGFYGEISKYGDKYRSLEARDNEPPPSESARVALAKGGHRCVAEVIAKVTAELEGMGLPPEDETIWTLLANYDIRSEAEGGRCGHYIRRLDELIPR